MNSVFMLGFNTANIDSLKTFNDQSSTWDVVFLLGISLTLAAFLFIAFHYRKDKKEPKGSLKKHKKSKVDMNDLMLDINQSRNLYKKLAKECHPDRFIDSKENKIAESLFQEITENKRNFKKLEQLRLKANQELGLKII